MSADEQYRSTERLRSSDEYLAEEAVYAPPPSGHRSLYALQPSLLSIVDTRLVVEHLARQGVAINFLQRP